MAAIGRLVRLAPKLRELSVLHRNICKTNVALKPFKLPPFSLKSHNAWNLVRYCSSESVLEGDISAVEFDEQNTKDKYRSAHSLKRRLPRHVEENESEVHRLSKDISEWLSTYFSVSKEKFEEFLTAVETQEYKIDKYDMILLLRCMGDLMPGVTKEEKCQMVDRVWPKLIENHVNLDQQLYNTLIMVYVENDHSFSPAEILQEMQDKGLEPNMVTFKRLIAAYCNKGDVTSAKQLLEFMQADNVPIGPEVFNSFIKGHLVNGDLKGAEEVVQVMRDINLTITDETYARIICGLADMKELSQIPRFLEEFREIQFRLTPLVDIMISMKQNGLNEFDSEINKMVESSMLFLSDFTVCINKCLALGYTDIAEKIGPLQNKDILDKQSATGYVENYIQSLSVSRLDKQTFENMLNDLINKSKTITADFPKLAYTFYQLNLHDVAFLLLEKALEMKENVSAHCFFPAVVHYKETGNMEKMTDVLKIMKNYPSIERLSYLRYIAVEMMPFFVEHLDGKDKVIQFLKKYLNEENALSAYFWYLLHYKPVDEALDFAKNNKNSVRYNILLGEVWSIPDHKTFRSFMDLCSGEGYFKIRVHEQYLKLLLTHGASNNAWDEVDEILKDIDLLIYREPIYNNAPESIKKRMQIYMESQFEYNEQKTSGEFYIMRRQLRDAVNSGNIDRSKDVLNKLYRKKYFGDYEELMIQFLVLCVEMEDLKGAVDYFEKFCNLHSDGLKKYQLKYDKILKFKVIDLLIKMNLISTNKSEQLKKLFVENEFIDRDFQIFSSKKVQELLNKDLNECTNYVVESYKATGVSHGIIFLFQELVKSEKHEHLQKVFDEMIPQIGEDVVLSHLVLSLINCDQIQKALKVCSVQEENISSLLCTLIRRYGQIEQVERFVEATKYVSYRAALLNSLMDLYLNKRKYDKALRVIDMYEEEFLELAVKQKIFLVSKLLSANYPINQSLKHEYQMLMKRNDSIRTIPRGNTDTNGNELKNKMKSNEQLDESLREKRVDYWFEKSFGLRQLYAKDSELFDKVTSEVQEDNKKLTYIFMNFLVLKKVEKAKELLSKYPDILTRSDYKLFRDLVYYIKKMDQLNKIENILREEFTDRRDLLLRFHTEIMHKVKNIEKDVKNRYNKLLDDGFQISDIDKDILADIENKLTTKNRSIPWKTDSNNETIVTETSDIQDTTVKRNEQLDESLREKPVHYWFEKSFGLRRLYAIDSELFDKVTSEVQHVQEDKKKLTYIFMNFLVLKKVEKAKELLSKYPDILTRSDYKSFRDLVQYLKKMDQLNKIENILREEFTDRRDLLLRFHTEIMHKVKNNEKYFEKRYNKLLDDGFQISDIDKDILADIENKLTTKNRPIPWKTDSNNETIVTETSDILDTTVKSEELD